VADHSWEIYASNFRLGAHRFWLIAAWILIGLLSGPGVVAFVWLLAVSFGRPLRCRGQLPPRQSCLTRRLTPNPPCSLAHPLELTSFILDGKMVSSDRRGETALRAERQAF
jgi:hypothetical protein